MAPVGREKAETGEAVTKDPRFVDFLVAEIDKRQMSKPTQDLHVHEGPGRTQSDMGSSWGGPSPLHTAVQSAPGSGS